MVFVVVKRPKWISRIREPGSAIGKRISGSPDSRFRAKQRPPSRLLQLVLLNRILLIGFLLIISVTFPQSADAGKKPIGQTLFISGTVEFRAVASPKDESSGKPRIQPAAFQPWQKVRFRQPVYETDEFRTRQGSRLKIKFNDNSLIALGPNSTLRVSSYLFKPQDRLRQGVIKVAHGLAMYIVNKSQNNKKSTLQIVSPSANISARGTHGFASVSSAATIVANLAGSVATKNIDPSVAGQQIVGPMQKNVIEKGRPPTKPVRLTNSEAKSIRNFTLGLMSSRPSARVGDKPLVQMEETEDKEEGSDSAESQAGGTIEKAKGTSEAKSGEGKTVTETGSGKAPQEKGTGFTGSVMGAFFKNIGSGPAFGNAVDFAPGNNPFQPSMMRGCGS